MRVLLKLVLDCSPDAAWRAVRDPAVFRAVSAPFSTFTSLEPDGFPSSWPEGPHPVEVHALGLIGVGDQIIDISFSEKDGVRMVRDLGGGLDGALSLVDRWDHTMAVSEAPGGKTLYRDQLIVSAGILTLPLWLGFWGFWQWRAFRLRQLAPSWR